MVLAEHGRRIRVLVVDDDPGVAAITRQMAEQLGHVVESIGDSRLFVTAVVRFKPDVIIIDVLMPEVDGFELMQCLIDLDYTGHVVVMSGAENYPAMVASIAKAKGRMTVAALHKPFRLAELKAALGHAAGRGSSEG
ncbi:response regulator [Dongia deserti]|uniref:response regulator n=1 Tax=Dongia deserti TaxID=2268030 RepID=UPI000E65A8E5|nr:response regulator [Dongia deserti]